MSNGSYIHYLNLEACQSRHRGKECYLLPTIVKRVQGEIHPQSTSWCIALKSLEMPVIRNTSDKYLSNKYIWSYTCQESLREQCSHMFLSLYHSCFLPQKLPTSLLIFTVNCLCIMLLFECQHRLTDVLFLMTKIIITEIVIKNTI